MEWDIRTRKTGNRYVASFKAPGRKWRLVEENGLVKKYESELEAYKGGFTALSGLLRDTTVGWRDSRSDEARRQAEALFSGKKD